MSRKGNEPKIFLDADVVIHFIKGGQSLLLPKIFPNRFVMLDKVYNELTSRNSKNLEINNFLNYSKIPIISFPIDSEIIREYANLLRGNLGEGEAACLSVARFRKEYIASSNLTDIFDYCKIHSIVYYTTMDLLLELFEQKLLTEAECDKFIYDVKNKNSKLIKEINSIIKYKELKKTR